MLRIGRSAWPGIVQVGGLFCVKSFNAATAAVPNDARPLVIRIMDQLHGLLVSPHALMADVTNLYLTRLTTALKTDQVGIAQKSWP
jgi:hypothetical protein